MNESGPVNPVDGKLKSGAWYKKTKREVFADPRTYDKHPRFPVKRLAAMYGINDTTFLRWKKEAKDEARRISQ